MMYLISIDGVPKMVTSSITKANVWILSEILANDTWLKESKAVYNKDGGMTKESYYTKNGTVFSITEVESI